MRRRILGLRLGALSWILAAGVHMYGRLSVAAASTEQEFALEELASTVVRDSGLGVGRTVFETSEGISIGFALLLFLLGFLTLLLSRSNLLPDSAARSVAGMSAVSAIAMLIVAVANLGPAIAIAFGLGALAFMSALPGPALRPSDGRGSGTGTGLA